MPLRGLSGLASERTRKEALMKPRRKPVYKKGTRYYHCSYFKKCFSECLLYLLEPLKGGRNVFHNMEA